MITSPTRTLRHLIMDFLTDLANAEKSPHTLRAYTTDLRRFADAHNDELMEVTPDSLRSFFTTTAQLKPASRARIQAALTSFFAWAELHGHMTNDPMRMVKRVTVEAPLPRPKLRTEVETIFHTIPAHQRRDRLLFGLMFELGLRVSEALRIYVEDISLELDNERITVLGKRNRQRTLLLDDPRLIKQIKGYLTHMGYKHGLLFRAAKNGDGDPLRYQTVQERWAKYCDQATVSCTLHQLRHSHATEMVTDGVSLATIRKRLGHVNIQTTLRYADQADATSDAELRAWRRRQRRP